MEKVYIRKQFSYWTLGKPVHIIAYYHFINSNSNKYLYDTNLFQATFYKDNNNVNYFIEVDQSPTEIALLDPNKVAFINRTMDY